jgi:uncharacterized alkaline shock family protein YloU
LKLSYSLNRAIVIVVLCAIFFAASIALLAIAHDLFLGYGFASERGLVDSSIDRAASRLHAFPVLHPGEIIYISLTIEALTAFFLWLELRGLVRRRPRLVLSRGTLGKVVISMDQVGLLAQHETEAIEGVREVHTFATSRKTGVEVRQTVAIEIDRQLPVVAEQIQQRVKQSLEYHLGFPVIGVQVALQRTSLSKAVV